MHAQIDGEMKKMNDFLIPFIGLKLGKHQFEYQVGNTFFNTFEYEDFNSSDINVEVSFEKKSTMLELLFKHSGTVNVACDVTGEDFDMPVDGNRKLVVNFGDEFNNDNEEMLILPHGEHQIDVSQYIYEMIVLSVPLRRVHTGVLDGSLKSAALDKLNEISVTEINTDSEQETQEIDPRWDKLKQLLKD